MEIWDKTRDDIHIIGISGRMDTLGSKDVESRLDSLLEQKKAKMIIDLSGVDYISSVGLRVLLSALKKQREHKGYIHLVSLQPFVRDVFKMTGFDKIFPIYSTQEEAIINMPEGSRAV